MVKQFKFFMFCLLAAFVFISCSKEDEAMSIDDLEELLRTRNLTAHPEQRHFQNNPLPVGKDCLRVLCIGSSYTEDALTYVPHILQGTEIPNSSYSIYKAIIGASTLETWWNTVANNDTIQLLYVAGSRMSLERGVWKDLLAQPWDVISLRQFFGDAADYATFTPWLQKLIDFIREKCPNKNVTFAWQTAWSCSELYPPYKKSHESWIKISLVVQQMVMTDGIDVLIPAGTAIQNARASSLNTSSELTRDGTHLDLGIGCYIASCTLVQSLFAPVFGITVLGNEVIPLMRTSSDAIYPSQPVTEENREECQRCAIAAVNSPFAIMH